MSDWTELHFYQTQNMGSLLQHILSIEVKDFLHSFTGGSYSPCGKRLVSKSCPQDTMIDSLKVYEPLSPTMFVSQAHVYNSYGRRVDVNCQLKTFFFQADI